MSRFESFFLLFAGLAGFMVTEIIRSALHEIAMTSFLYYLVLSTGLVVLGFSFAFFGTGIILLTRLIIGGVRCKIRQKS